MLRCGLMGASERKHELRPAKAGNESEVNTKKSLILKNRYYIRYAAATGQFRAWGLLGF